MNKSAQNFSTFSSNCEQIRGRPQNLVNELQPKFPENYRSFCFPTRSAGSFGASLAFWASYNHTCINPPPQTHFGTPTYTHARWNMLESLMAWWLDANLWNLRFITCALKREAQVVFCKEFYIFGISHSPWTPLGHDHRWSIYKHYVDKM